MAVDTWGHRVLIVSRYFRCLIGSTTLLALLNRRARHCPIGTVYTTVAGLGLQKLAAALAFIEPLTRVRWHGFFFSMPAFRASDLRL